MPPLLGPHSRPRRAIPVAVVQSHPRARDLGWSSVRALTQTVLSRCSIGPESTVPQPLRTPLPPPSRVSFPGFSREKAGDQLLQELEPVLSRAEGVVTGLAVPVAFNTVLLETSAFQRGTLSLARGTQEFPPCNITKVVVN